MKRTFHFNVDLDVAVNSQPGVELGKNAVPVYLVGTRFGAAMTELMSLVARGFVDGVNGEPLSSDAVIYTEGYGRGRKLREESGV